MTDQNVRQYEIDGHEYLESGQWHPTPILRTSPGPNDNLWQVWVFVGWRQPVGFPEQRSDVLDAEWRMVSR